MTGAKWHFRMLGKFEALEGGEIVSGIHRYKHCQMLAYLAFMRGMHSRAALCARFWPLSDDADNNLSQAISKLIAILKAPRPASDTLLQSPRDGTLGLLSELFTRDIDDFDQAIRKAVRAASIQEKIACLVTAIELYRGEFMLGYSAENEYHWIEKPRLDYQSKFVRALNDLAGLFREIALTEFALLCEEHTAHSAPLSTEERRLLRSWNATSALETSRAADSTSNPTLVFSAALPVSVPTPKKGVNSKAVASYNQGRRLWKLRSEEALRDSIAWFERAIEADETYALAYAGMADTYSLLGYYSYLQPAEATGKARWWAQEAWKRAEGQSDEAQSAILTAQAWIKMVYDWEWVEAEEAFIEAIYLNPRNETAHQWYAFYLMLQGNTQQSLDEINTAWDYEPRSGILSKSVGERYYYKRLYEKANEKYLEALRDAPKYCLTHYCLGRSYEQIAIEYRNAGLTEEAKEEFDEAIAAFQRAMQFSDVLEGPQNPALIAGLAHAYAKSGERGQSLDLLEELKEQRNTAGCYVSPVALATVHLGLDETEAALDCLAQAVQEHPGDLLLIHIDPRFHILRENVGFAAILREMNLLQWTAGLAIRLSD